jgi:TusA-related sulfurtransferase
MEPANDKPIVNLDLGGWYGPLLLLKVKRLLDGMRPGQLAWLFNHEGEVSQELKLFLKAAGHQLLEVVDQPEGANLKIRRGPS